jgi:phospholipid/cholesterol/gamma-HCH transport system substrate-binding protein
MPIVQPEPVGRPEAGHDAAPIAAKSETAFRARGYGRRLAGLATVLAIAGIIALAATLFRGGLTPTVPVTVLSPRAGLVMDPDAKVKLRDVQVGKVSAIEERPDGQAVIHLAMDPTALQLIPANVLVNIAATTVFGAKYVQLVAPEDPSPNTMYSGQVLDAGHVTVEINTVFQQLTHVLSKIDPAKLNETLGAIASAFNGRGQKIGQALSDLDALLNKIDPSMSTLDHELAVLPDVATAYADAAPDLIDTADNATRISRTIVDEQQNLDALLVSAIGLADIGNDVVGGNQQALTDVLHLLVPTTDLTNQYNAALNCTLAGILPIAKSPPSPEPGVVVSFGFTPGLERFRYPQDLP